MLSFGKIIDLTHSITSSIATWETIGGFEMKTTLDYHECASPVRFRVQKFSTPAGVGTHIDAPAHCVEGGKTIAMIPLTDLIAPAVVIDVSQKMAEDYVVSVQDLLFFEQQHGTIPPHCFVLIYTGWSRLWNSPARYRNADERGIKHFPSLSEEVANILCQRGVAGIGIDTLSPDSEGTGHPVHKIMLQEGKFIVENVANGHLLPPVGATVFILPMKIEEATESPVRMIAIVP